MPTSREAIGVETCRRAPGSRIVALLDWPHGCSPRKRTARRHWRVVARGHGVGVGGRRRAAAAAAVVVGERRLSLDRGGGSWRVAGIVALSKARTGAHRYGHRAGPPGLRLR